MAKSRSCKLCHTALKQSVAAHTCPHGQPCRYHTDDSGNVVDWQSPQCASCRIASPATATRFGLTAAAMQLLDELG